MAFIKGVQISLGLFAWLPRDTQYLPFTILPKDGEKALKELRARATDPGALSVALSQSVALCHLQLFLNVGSHGYTGAGLAFEGSI